MTEEQIEKEINEVHNTRAGMVRMLILATLANLLLLAGGGFVLFQTNQRAVGRERAARVASEQAAETGRRTLCSIYVLLDDAYASAKPGQSGAVGIKLATLIADARVANRCPPRKR